MHEGRTLLIGGCPPSPLLVRVSTPLPLLHGMHEKRTLFGVGGASPFSPHPLFPLVHAVRKERMLLRG